MSVRRSPRITSSIVAVLAALVVVGIKGAVAAGPDAFSQPLAGLSDHDRATVHLGNSLFRKSWRPAPSETTASDGLGPLYNARACADCHVGDGRGHPDNGLILKLPARDPVYGAQIQDKAVSGVKAEGWISVTYREQKIVLSSGEVVRLRQPDYRVVDPAYGPISVKGRLSPRLAPPVFGLGLLEAVDVSEILAYADPGDQDGDGISGRANRVRSRAHGDTRLGRFGWKAEQATIADQNAVALSNDIGIGNPLYPALWGDCTFAQTGCRQAPHGGSERHGGLEVSAKVARHLTFYLQGLDAPAAREAREAGAQLFRRIGCADCHRAEMRTGADHPLAALRGRKIRPYSDMLLHDMGEGLADDLAEGEATGREWRTAPLWGIGLTEVVNGNNYYLHDGRARSLTEAILWHGGEGAAARDKFRSLPAAARAELLKFLRSL